MNRRDFLKGVSAGGILLLGGFSFARMGRTEVAFSYDLELPYREEVRLWLPIPIDTDYQRLTSLSFEGNYRRAGLSVSFSPRRVSLIEGNHSIPAEVRKYLEPSEHIPTTGKVKEIAQKIVRGKETPI